MPDDEQNDSQTKADDLASFSARMAEQMGFAPGVPEAEASGSEGAAVPADGPGDGDDEGNPDDAEIHEAFWASLMPGQVAAAERSQEVLDTLWTEFSEASGLDAGEGEEDASLPSTGADVVAWALENDAELVENGWAGGASEFLVLAASDARLWLATAETMGWPPESRPQDRDLPRGLAMASVAAQIPGARVLGTDPVQRGRDLPPPSRWLPPKRPG